MHAVGSRTTGKARPASWSQAGSTAYESTTSPARTALTSDGASVSRGAGALGVAVATGLAEGVAAAVAESVAAGANDGAAVAAVEVAVGVEVGAPVGAAGDGVRAGEAAPADGEGAAGSAPDAVGVGAADDVAVADGAAAGGLGCEGAAVAEGACDAAADGDAVGAAPNPGVGTARASAPTPGAETLTPIAFGGAALPAASITVGAPMMPTWLPAASERMTVCPSAATLGTSPPVSSRTRRVPALAADGYVWLNSSPSGVGTNAMVAEPPPKVSVLPSAPTVADPAPRTRNRIVVPPALSTAALSAPWAVENRAVTSLALVRTVYPSAASGTSVSSIGCQLPAASR